MKSEFKTSRRSLLRDTIKFAGFTAASRLLPVGTTSPNASAQTKAVPEKEGENGSTLILLGTQGGPGVTLTRSQTASLLIVENRQYLVDCGYGTLRALVQAGLGFNNLSNIFLTHLHNDHTSDVAALLSHKWSSGRTRETTVYGPYGTAKLVNSAVLFFEADAEIRIINEGRPAIPESLFHGKDFDVAGITEIFRDEYVVVKAVENTHYPERAKKQMPHRSFAYRFDTATRSVVFSGDTAYSENLVLLSRDADIFLCETRGLPQRRQLNRAKTDAEGKESIGLHVMETHSTTEDVGRMATKARVKTVVLNHLLGGGSSKDALEAFESKLASSVNQFFSGSVIVGRDQMRI